MPEVYRADTCNGELARLWKRFFFLLVADAAVGGSPSSASERRDRAPIMVSKSPSCRFNAGREINYL